MGGFTMADSRRGRGSNKAQEGRGFTKPPPGVWIGEDPEGKRKIITEDQEAREELIEELRSIDEEE
jgi:hypothetical protein